jgi:seryl-tRNA synthetase
MPFEWLIMLDIRLIRENPEIVRESQRRRKSDVSIVDKMLEYDNLWKEALKRINQLRALRNAKSREIGNIKKQGGGISGISSEMKSISAEIKELEVKVDEYLAERDRLLRSIPNLLDDSVPDGEDEGDNRPIRFWGSAKVQSGHLEEFKKESLGKMPHTELNFSPISHVDLMEEKGLADIARAAKVSSSRFYYLKGKMTILDLALQRFALDQLMKKGYVPVLPPYMLRKEAEEGATDLSAFEDTIYKIDGEDLYMIPTSEHPISAMYMNEILEPEMLPVKYAGVSTCFRKEAGAHGKDTKGIFRVHQFNKVEQFVFAKPEDSRAIHEELIANAEEIFRGLELPYRIVNVCSGDLGAVASKKYDLEAWMPVQGRFREMVSASNVLEYQSRRLNIRYRGKGENIFVHTLNSTAIATTRAAVAIMENHQTEDGRIIIPKALRQYTGFDEI